jgi:nucleoside diphosphate kinase
LALIKEDAMNHMGMIIDCIFREGFRVFKLKSFHLDRRDIEEFAEINKQPPR